ncbi:MAG: hypothetical protein LBM08_03915 [Dysgonamonadaceae bacterium]|jgi:hypothetical protein|nr:hypothetical protein [Dysgonamonadaceae bacterium]
MANKKTTPPEPADGQKSEWADKSARLFKIYPNRDMLYFTSDGQAFFDESDAVNHAGILKEQSIEKVEK